MITYQNSLWHDRNEPSPGISDIARWVGNFTGNNCLLAPQRGPTAHVHSTSRMSFPTGSQPENKYISKKCFLLAKVTFKNSFLFSQCNFGLWNLLDLRFAICKCKCFYHDAPNLKKFSAWFWFNWIRFSNKFFFTSIYVKITFFLY